MRNRRDDEDGDYCAGVLFPDVLKYREGIYRVRFELLEVGDMFGYSKRRKFFRIILPYAMADILVGMRIGLGYSWARHYRCGDGGGVHRAWTYDFICTADVADRQGDRGDSGDRGQSDM